MTGPQKEAVVHDRLKADGIGTLFLHYIAQARHARRLVDVKRSYFPRYIFVCAVPAYVYEVATTAGVVEVLCNGNGPLQVPNIVIDDLRTRGDENGLVEVAGAQKTGRAIYPPGTEAQLLAGPLAGFLATVELDSGKDVRVWVEMLRGKCLATVRAADLQATNTSP